MPPPSSAFHHPPFILFWLSRICASIASQMQALAVGWQIYDLTRSPFDLGLVGLMQFLPLISLMLIAGHAADRYNRQLIVEASLAICGAAVAVLALATAAGAISRELILATILVFGCARAFQQPTTSALLPAIVPSALLSRAVAASSSSMQIAIIVGPAIGGVLYAVSPPLVYAAAAALFLFASLLISLIKVSLAPPRREPLSFDLMFAGIRYIWRNPFILGAISLDLFAVLLGGATSLLPIFARDIFQTGPEGLGILQLSPAVGALAVSLPLARWPMRGRIGPMLFATVAGFGCATIAFGLSRSFPLTMLVLALYGATDMVSVVIRDTLIQVGTPDEMRGRVNAVHSLFVGTSNQLGQFRAGAMAAWIGTIPAVLVGGGATLLIVLAGLRVFPGLARLKSIEDVAPAARPALPGTFRP